ncbi:mediator complex subunit 13 C-terminal-domain-containing protein [Geopyxis carbonaria]|nr:mediator complex subunit 13 C-terminal-domain-containing protein [Geopyxis carbonaria]
MDPPTNALTNALKIDNLSRIPYTIYAPGVSSGDAHEPFPDSEPSAPDDDVVSISSSVLAQDIETLRKAERTLKAEGVPVLANLRTNGLWVFHVYGILDQSAETLEHGELPDNQPPVDTVKDERWLQMDKRLKEEWGLEEAVRDVFLASSLNPSTTSTSANTVTSTSSQRIDSNPVTPASKEGPVTIDLTMDEDESGDEEEEEDEPYQNFITAVLSVLSFHLSLKDGFTPLNTRTFVSPSSIPATKELDYEYDEEEDRAIGKPGTLPGVAVTAPEIVCPLVLEIDAYMSSLGSLVITPHSEKQPAIRRLAHCNLTAASLEHRDVFMAPWGEWGTLWVPGEDAEDSSSELAKEKWKENVISYLQDRGIISVSSEETSKSVLQEAIEKGKWLNVEISFDEDAESDDNVHRVLWPETLLFVRATEGDKTAKLPEGPPKPSKVSWESKGGTRTMDTDVWKAAINHPEYKKLASGKLAMLLATLEDDDESSKTAERDLGAEWWDVESALSWAWEWFKGADARDKILEERKKKQEAEAEAAMLAEQEKKNLEEIEEKGKAKLGADLKVEVGSGVYPTPPDGANIINSSAGPTSTSSTGPTIGISFPGTGGGDMDMDWTGDISVSEKKDNDGLHEPTMGVEADLFGENMDAEFGMGVTEDDFDFFDQPDMAFGDDNGGVGDMDIDHVGGVDMDMGGIETNMAMEMGDLHMETPGMPMLGQSESHPADAQDQKPVEAPTEEKVVLENQVRTPPLSPHRAIRLLVPGYSPPQTNGSNLTPPMTGSMKTPSTAPGTVAAQSNSATTSSKRRMSLYAPITFTENVEMADKKYAPGGRFFLPIEVKDKDKYKDEHATKPERMPKPKRIKESLAPEVSPADVPDNHEVAAVPEVPPEPPQTEDIVLDENDMFGSDSNWEEYETESSDADDTTEYEESIGNGEAYCNSPVAGSHPPLGFLSRLPGQTPRRSNQDTGSAVMSDAVSQNKDGTVVSEVHCEDLAYPPWQCMQPNPLAASLMGVFEDKALVSNPVTLGILSNEADFLEVASLAADQMAGWIHATWRDKNETVAEEELDEEQTLINRRTGADQRLVEGAVKTVFKDDRVVRCNLETYAMIEDSIQEPPPLPPPPPLGSSHLHGIKPNISQRRNKDENTNNNRSWDIFLLSAPHVRLQRGDNTLEMLPPALHFWETFGLAPISGGKNVISFCLHPAGGAIEEGAEFLLQRVSASYEAGRFGAHVRGNLGDFVKNGLVGLELPPNAPRTYDFGMKTMVGQMESFGPFIAHGVADEGVNVVIYVINPFSHPAALVDLSTAFVRMRKSYEASIATIAGAKPNNLVLQVVPANFVAHKLGLVMRVNVVHRLAVEVYTRCIQTDAGSPSLSEASIISSPPIQLARPLPKTIEFRLTTDPSPALLKENQLLHLVYAPSIDSRWLAATWTSSTGDQQHSLLLHESPTPLKTLWATTTALIRTPALHWRLAITRLGSSPMPEEEITQWRALAATHPRISALHLLSADLAPPLTVRETLPEVKMDAFFPSAPLPTGASPLVSTPTPGTGILSPDTSATPPAAAAEAALEADPDTELVDVADESWGVLHGGGRKGVVLRKGNGTQGYNVIVALRLEGEAGREGGKTLREIMESWRGLGVIGSFQAGRGGVPWGVGWVRDALGIARIL